MEENNSGMGFTTIIPDEIKKFNWGAFFFVLIWAIVYRWHKMIASILLMILFYILLFIFLLLFLKIKTETVVPFIAIFITICNTVISIIGGINGNKVAWENKKWKSIKDFQNTQKIWAVFGIIICIILPILKINSVYNEKVAADKILADKKMQLETKRAKRNAIVDINHVILTSLKKNDRLDLNSEKICVWFKRNLEGSTLSNDKVVSSNGAVFSFIDNGLCNKNSMCTITIDTNGEAAPNEKGKDIMVIVFYVNENGTIDLRNSDFQEIYEPAR